MSEIPWAKMNVMAKQYEDMPLILPAVSMKSVKAERLGLAKGLRKCLVFFDEEEAIPSCVLNRELLAEILKELEERGK